MEAIYTWLNSLVNKNKSDFKKWSNINWLNPYTAYDYEIQRETLLKPLAGNVLFKETKPYYNQISKGCEICGSGKWSCLFITNKCNANCFYCPASQLNDELPSTQGMDFEHADEYASYVKHFDFKGVSFSGGEPLLFFDRTQSYLRAVRKHCNTNLYVWMYTNGILADKEKLNSLAQMGLNEIRFDIGATGFSLDRLKIAKGIIPNVTIEIPAVPEEKEKLISLLPEMVKAGVTNLNLHQLKLTQHNAPKLLQRGYTIINAERPLVLESELTALEIINAAKDMDLPIGINYCSFHFKNRFQKAGYRHMIAKKLFPDAQITNNGYIREFKDNTISYKAIKIRSVITDIANTSEITIDNKKYYYTISTLFQENNLPIEYQSMISDLLIKEPQIAPADNLLFKVWQYEYIESGLRSY